MTAVATYPAEAAPLIEAPISGVLDVRWAAAKTE
jgi:hypothetical protein